MSSEVNKCKEIKHPHFVKIYDAEWNGAEGHNAFSVIAMELAETSLEDLIKDGEWISASEIEKIIAQVSSCMEEVSKKFAHRDIKPANILRFNNGDYKLTDLGISVKIKT